MYYLIHRMTQSLPHLLLLFFFSFGMRVMLLRKQPDSLLFMLLRESHHVAKLMIVILRVALALPHFQGRICIHFID